VKIKMTVNEKMPHDPSGFKYPYLIHDVDTEIDCTDATDQDRLFAAIKEWLNDHPAMVEATVSINGKGSFTIPRSRS
jgi:hypothetical protein